jgi:steroid delta-isomerase-like uncharacterized protein
MGVGKDLLAELEKRYNKHDWQGLASLYDNDAVFVDPTGRYEGREAIRAYVEEAEKPFSNQTNETSLVIEDGDTVVSEWVLRATHATAIALPDGRESPATGKTIELAGVTVLTVRDGKVASEHDYFDMLAVMTQLGLMPGT